MGMSIKGSLGVCSWVLLVPSCNFISFLWRNNDIVFNNYMFMIHLMYVYVVVKIGIWPDPESS